MPFVFRRGDRDDLPGVYELNRKSLAESWSAEALSDALEQGYELFLCLDETLSGAKRLAGYLLCHDVFDEAHIMQIVVAPDYHRRGVAEQLSRNLMAEKTDMRLLLEVRASNHAAQALYYKLGFEQCGIRKAYYVAGHNDGVREDAVLMQFQDAPP